MYCISRALCAVCTKCCLTKVVVDRSLFACWRGQRTKQRIEGRREERNVVVATALTCHVKRHGI